MPLNEKDSHQPLLQMKLELDKEIYANEAPPEDPKYPSKLCQNVNLIRGEARSVTEEEGIQRCRFLVSQGYYSWEKE